jgi:hypothetical protein
LLALALVIPCNAGGQVISCTARGTEASLRGRCTADDSTVGTLALVRPTPIRPHLWSGTIEISGRTEPIGVDVRQGGALRLGRAWLPLSVHASGSDSLGFAFDSTWREPPSEIDAEILRSAAGYLSDSTHWDPVDRTDMEVAPTQGFNCPVSVRRSMFCALYRASEEVAGDYAHFRPAIDAVRQSVARLGRSYLHPLVDLNNDPGTTLSDVQSVLTSALETVRPPLIRCTLQRRAEVQFLGACIQRGDTLLRFFLESPIGGSVGSWRGSGTAADDSTHPPFTQITLQDVWLQVRDDGATFRSSLGWYDPVGVRLDERSFAFEIDPNRPSRPGQEDLDILLRTRSLLSDTAVWNRRDERTYGYMDCRPSVRRSLFCALRDASIEVRGIQDAGPAGTALLAAAARARPDAPHPQSALNNDPRSTLAEIHAVLDEAIASVRFRMVTERR